MGGGVKGKVKESRRVVPPLIFVLQGNSISLSKMYLVPDTVLILIYFNIFFYQAFSFPYLNPNSFWFVFTPLDYFTERNILKTYHKSNVLALFNRPSFQVPERLKS